MKTNKTEEKTANPRIQEDTARIWEEHWEKTKDVDNYICIEKSNDIWTKNHFKIIDEEIKKLKKNQKFLEAGCGLGQWCFYANSKGVPVVGVDIAKKTILQLKRYVKDKKLEGIEFICDDLNNTKLKENSFDYFISLGVIEHFQDPTPMLNALYKVTKTGGSGLITVPNVYCIHTITRPISKLFQKWHIGYECSYTPMKLKKIAEQAGFKVKGHGIIPSGELFGRTLNNTWIVGKYIRKLSYSIERKQNTFGFISYVQVYK